MGTAPAFAIGQRALLVRAGRATSCGTASRYLDEAPIAAVRALGGIRAIAISHPHFYGTMADWADAFELPVYIHAADREWIGRPERRSGVLGG